MNHCEKVVMSSMNRTCSIHDDLLFSLCQMSVMIFKRAVYASRKKSNSFRRESKVNPRKAVNVSVTFHIILLFLYSCHVMKP